jgi:hypothetical protein
MRLFEYRSSGVASIPLLSLVLVIGKNCEGVATNQAGKSRSHSEKLKHTQLKSVVRCEYKSILYLLFTRKVGQAQARKWILDLRTSGQNRMHRSLGLEKSQLDSILV